VEVRVLGPVEVVHEGRAVAITALQQRLILASLALANGRTVSVAQLSEDLWDDELPDSSTQALRAYVSRLRKTLSEAGIDDTVLRTQAPGYALELATDGLDAQRFEQLVQAADKQLADGEPTAAAALLRTALDLWRGPALADIADRRFAVPHVARLEEARVSALEAAIEAILIAGRHREVTAELEGLTTAHPLRERFWRQRMLAEYRCGRQADALRTFQELREVLADEVGLDPAPETQALERAIVAQDPALDPPRPREGVPEPSTAKAVAIRVMLVDDHPMWRVGVRALLDRDDRTTVVGEAENGPSAVETALALRPDVILMDLHLPGIDGAEATRQITAQLPSCRILMLSASGEETDVATAVSAGAVGYLLKSGTASDVVDAVVRTADGEPVFTPALARVVLAQLQGGAAARSVELPSRDRSVLRLLADGKSFDEIGVALELGEGDVSASIALTVERLQAVRDGGTARRMVRTVLFTDLVDSTERASAVGDRQWREVLAQYHEVAGGTVEKHRGRLVKTIGDGLLATFIEPADAIDAATSLTDAVHTLDLRLRSGIHVGECEVASDDDVSGMAVHVAARVMAAAVGDEVLVSQTVRDLLLGGDVELDDRGEHDLKGLPGTWRVFAVMR
jgi:DNA-binding NarL/FixJ family response regulator/DNA-binding SARP family transcriptional activator